MTRSLSRPGCARTAIMPWEGPVRIPPNASVRRLRAQGSGEPAEPLASHRPDRRPRFGVASRAGRLAREPLRRPGKPPRGASISGSLRRAGPIRAGSTARAAPGKSRHALVAFRAVGRRPATKARSRRIPSLLANSNVAALSMACVRAAVDQRRRAQALHCRGSIEPRGTKSRAGCAPRAPAVPEFRRHDLRRAYRDTPHGDGVRDEIGSRSLCHRYVLLFLAGVALGIEACKI
jgi:hypothetical protein